MPRHPRTIWKPLVIDFTFNNTVAPDLGIFQSIRSVDADASQGLQLKHVETNMSFALDSTANLNTDRSAGFVGYFKWPTDAATPSFSTIDLENRTKIFARKNVILQGIQVSKYSIRAKTVRLTLGEELWWFYHKSYESSVDVQLIMIAMTQHWETQA